MSSFFVGWAPPTFLRNRGPLRPRTRPMLPPSRPHPNPLPAGEGDRLHSKARDSEAVNLGAQWQALLGPRARDRQGRRGTRPDGGVAERATLGEGHGQRPVEGVAGADGVHDLDGKGGNPESPLLRRDETALRASGDDDVPGPELSPKGLRRVVALGGGG